MAKTAFATDDELTKKAWDEQLFRDARKDMYFSKFMGTTQDSMVYVRSQLTKVQGDTIKFGIRMRLTGSGKTSGQVLEGNEEKLTTANFYLSLEEYAHAVRDAGPLDRQRAMFSIDAESSAALQDWGAEKQDQLCFDAIQASPTKVFYGGTATSTGTLTTADKLTPALISKARVWATTGGNRAIVPLRPIKINGKKYFVLLVHPDVMYDLKQDTTFAQARREALERGNDNPIFSGAEAIWDGVVVHEHENMGIVTNWGAGANVPGGKCALLGAQALCFAEGKRPSTKAEEFDYGREHGYGLSFMMKAGKPVFNSKDYGSLAIYVARTQISDAA